MGKQINPQVPPYKTIGTFEETTHSHLQQSLSATPAQRLAWLEEALELAYQAGALPLKNHRDKFGTESIHKIDVHPRTIER